MKFAQRKGVPVAEDTIFRESMRRVGWGRCWYCTGATCEHKEGCAPTVVENKVNCLNAKDEKERIAIFKAFIPKKDVKKGRKRPAKEISVE